MKIGYARVSTTQQNLMMQEQKLQKAGCEQIYFEKGSGRTMDRPTLQQVLSMLRKGDVLVVYSLSRLARTTLGAIKLTNELIEKGIHLEVVNQKIDTTTPTGRFFFTIMAALDELEAETTLERTRDALEARKAKGIKGGRKPGLSEENLRKARIAASLYKEGVHSVSTIAKDLGIGTKTLYRYLEHEGVKRNRYNQDDPV